MAYLAVIKFSVNGKPVPQGSMRAFNNHIVHNKPKELMAWRKLIATAAKEAGAEMTDAPIRIKVRFRLLKPKSVKRAYPTVPPDL